MMPAGCQLWLPEEGGVDVACGEEPAAAVAAEEVREDEEEGVL